MALVTNNFKQVTLVFFAFFDLLLINLLVEYYPLLLKYTITFHVYISLVWIFVAVRNSFLFL